MKGEAKGKRARGGCFARTVFILALVAALVLLVQWRYEDYQRRLIENVGMRIVPLYQYDYKEAVCTIGGQDKSVSTSGCGATCMSMVITYLTGNDRQTPQTLFERAYASGDYFGSGLSHEALDSLAMAYDVEGVWVDRDETAIRSALAAGFPVIAHMGPGTFTREGHYILLRGLTEDGRVVLNDPNSEKRSYQTYELSQILNEAKGTDPFMICRPMK